LFAVGDVVFDDVFETEAAVTELPRADEPELDHFGKVCVRFDEDDSEELAWRSWDHLKIVKRARRAPAVVDRLEALPPPRPAGGLFGLGFTVKGVAALPCFENLDALVAGMIVEIPKYMSPASSLRLDRAFVAEFSKAVLQFWRSHATEMPHWAEAARIVFSMAPSSAACKRIFSLLALMFDSNQRRGLMDFVEGSLMLNYNDRVVG
jgi:hypothetical protein